MTREMITLTERIKSLTYDQAEWQYHSGFISADEWTAYRHVWRRSAPRFSTLASEHDDCDCEVAS